MNQVLGAALTLACASTTLATPIGLPGPGPDYGYQWATIGDAGNRDISQAELDRWGWPANGALFTGGGVDHEYRISKYETTTAQWHEFVQVAWPHVQGDPIEEDRLTGKSMIYIGGQFDIDNILEPASPHWTWAARYCNWLHNGKGTDPSSWESGVYDASTFAYDADGVPLHDMTRAPGAKFFLPTDDEWKKAAHWDPEKDDGAGGYWLYPYGSDEPPISGHPDEGGETSGGWFEPLINDELKSIGLYDITSPWGLYDVSGGLRETLEGLDSSLSSVLIRTSGSFWGPWPLEWFDQVHGTHPGYSEWTTGSSQIGFRIAGAIPSPGTFAIILVLGIRGCRRSTRTA
ncbi:MAG: SUMF1/EgtB/PvdO family nonheme iron enzyme [Phycisphaerales bacterium]